jgi:uncharacterized membrane protein
MRAVASHFLGGNTVVRVGALILLVGVALLGRWAADREYFPPEARLILAAAIGIALCATGWRLRLRRPGFATTLQGGGVGALYVTAFMALRVYGFISPVAAFVLFVGLASTSQMLAILQNAQHLAVLGTVGAFLAPIMASTGSGNHVVLFGFYALVNLGILVVAWFKAWRVLNLVGFCFTFSVATAWGAERYRPELFASTEPFLIVHFLIYLAIPLLFAWRQTPRLRGWVDGALVFGTPTAVFAMQAALVQGERFWLAGSAFVMAAIYLGVASRLFKVAPALMRTVVEALAALGVAFGTMAIPFALDNHHITGATWALEGAGLLWLGLRQQRRLPRFSGVLLQLGAGIAFATAETPAGLFPVLNGRMLGCLMLALAALFISWLLMRHRERLHRGWSPARHALMAWGLLWWLGGSLVEVDDVVPVDFEPACAFGVFVLTAALLELVGTRLSWTAPRRVALGHLAVAYAFLPTIAAVREHPFQGGGFVPWIGGVAGYIALLRRHEADVAAPKVIGLLHAGTLWLCTILAVWEVGHAVGWLLAADRFDAMAATWRLSAQLLVPAAALGLTAALAHAQGPWPFAKWRQAYGATGAVGIWACLALASLSVSLFATASIAPLPYIPLLNPMDLSQGFALVALCAWIVAAQRRALAPAHHSPGPFVWSTAALGFVWLNAMLARAVHHQTGVRYAANALQHSATFQTGLSILWTMVALVAMVLGTRRRLRRVWFVAATLLGMVVVKLFVIDLATLSTVARIISFLVVGGLLLLVGFFSPVPPPRE